MWVLPIDLVPQGPPEQEVFLGDAVLLGLLIRGEHGRRLGRLGIRWSELEGSLTALHWDLDTVIVIEAGDGA